MQIQFSQNFLVVVKEDNEYNASLLTNHSLSYKVVSTNQNDSNQSNSFKNHFLQ